MFSIKKRKLNENILDNKYNILKKISTDAFKEYYLVKDIKSEKQYIAYIKFTNELEDNDSFNFKHEVKIMKMVSQLYNPYLVHLNDYGKGTFIYNGVTKTDIKYIIVDYYPNGNLSEYIDYCGGFKELHAKIIVDKILRGVRALHKAGICNRDLKPSNILLDEHFNPIIYDFVISGIFRNDNGEIKLNVMAGTNGFMSPQIRNGKLYSGDKTDIYCLGACLYYLVTGQSPNKIKNEDFLNNNPSGIMNKFSPELYNLLIRMLAYKEEDRPSVDEILSDKWFDEIRQLYKELYNEFLLNFFIPKLRKKKIKKRN